MSLLWGKWYVLWLVVWITLFYCYAVFFDTRTYDSSISLSNVSSQFWQAILYAPWFSECIRSFGFCRSLEDCDYLISTSNFVNPCDGFNTWKKNKTSNQFSWVYRFYSSFDATSTLLFCFCSRFVLGLFYGFMAMYYDIHYPSAPLSALFRVFATDCRCAEWWRKSLI